MISEIGKLTKFQNFPIWNINNFIEFFLNLENFGNLLIFEIEK